MLSCPCPGTLVAVAGRDGPRGGDEGGNRSPKNKSASNGGDMISEGNSGRGDLGL